MTWCLFLDDDRSLRDVPVPDKYRLKIWMTARSSQEALAIIDRLQSPMFMSLDHDLGGTDTAMVFLHCLAEKLSKPPEYQVHSENPIGHENIVAFIESWKKSLTLP